MGKKDDLPAMHFYVGDWLKAPDVQCMDYELKGIWFEMLCYMFESKQRGVLNYTEDELSRLLRLPIDLLKQKLQQIESKGIFSRNENGFIFCRRMIRDQEIREIRQKSGSIGGKKSFAQAKSRAKHTANTEDEDEDDIEVESKYESINSSSSQTLQPENTHWKIFAASYPKNGSCLNPMAQDAFCTLAQSFGEEVIISGVKAYDDHCRKTQKSYPYSPYIKSAFNWLKSHDWGQNWQEKTAAWVESQEKPGKSKTNKPQYGFETGIEDKYARFASGSETN